MNKVDIPFINYGLISNPVNWATVFLMALIAAIALDITYYRFLVNRL
jgi:hypothetical protein